MRFHVSADLFERDRLNPDVTNGKLCLRREKKIDEVIRKRRRVNLQRS